MILRIIVLTLLLGIFDSIYIFINKKMYTEILPAGKLIHILYAFSVWFIIALAINFLIIDRPDFNLLTIIKRVPFLALSIYWTLNMTNIMLLNKLSWKIIAVDTLWGIILLLLTTFIYSLLRKQLD